MVTLTLWAELVGSLKSCTGCSVDPQGPHWAQQFGFVLCLPLRRVEPLQSNRLVEVSTGQRLREKSCVLSQSDGVCRKVVLSSSGCPYPVVPGPWRRQIFKLVHSLSQPGVRASVRLVGSKFAWASLQKTLRNGRPRVWRVSGLRFIITSRQPFSHFQSWPGVLTMGTSTWWALCCPHRVSRIC